MSINITKEAMKAETELRHILANANKAVLATQLAWADRRAKYVASLPSGVRAVLVAAGVLPAGVAEDELTLEDLQFEEALEALPEETEAQ